MAGVFWRRIAGSAAVAALMVGACGEPAHRTGEEGPADAGASARPDGGGSAAPDAGAADAGAVDGGPADAGPTQEAILLTLLPVEGPRRGPVVLRLDVVEVRGGPATLVLELQSGDEWARATVLSQERSGRRAVIAWDSFADLDFDGEAPLRVRATNDAASAQVEFTIEIRNALDADRLVVTAHPLAPVGGGASSQGTGLDAIAWSGLAPGRIGQPRRIEVGRGPSVLRAAPHGRALAVLEEADDTVSLVTTPLDALVTGVARTATLQLPYGSPSDLAWSPDGRFLYVLGSRSDTQPATLWRFEPADDLLRSDPPEPLAQLRGPPMELGVDRSSGRLLVWCGSGGQGHASLALLRADGTELAFVQDSDTDEWGVPTDLAVSPRGDFALFSASLFGDELRVFSVTANSIAPAGGLFAGVRSPEGIVFHPAPAQGTLALVSNLERNTATPLRLDASGAPTAGTPVTGLSLAAEMDVIERGDQTGTVFVTGVNKLYRVTLSPDGTAVYSGVAVDFGPGTDNITRGVAVQR